MVLLVALFLVEASERWASSVREISSFNHNRGWDWLSNPVPLLVFLIEFLQATLGKTSGTETNDMRTAQPLSIQQHLFGPSASDGRGIPYTNFPPDFRMCLLKDVCLPCKFCFLSDINLCFFTLQVLTTSALSFTRPNYSCKMNSLLLSVLTLAVPVVLSQNSSTYPLDHPFLIDIECPKIPLADFSTVSYVDAWTGERQNITYILSDSGNVIYQDDVNWGPESQLLAWAWGNTTVYVPQCSKWGIRVKP